MFWMETGRGDGVQIFIGSENPLFKHAGCSMVVSPYMNSKEQIIGAIGVSGGSWAQDGEVAKAGAAMVK